MLKLMLLTTDEQTIRDAQDAGVDRIFLDLEYINKSERQKGRNTVISYNSLSDVPRIRRIVDKSQLLVRVNALYPRSKDEIDSVINDGADIIMLPMVYDADDVKRFVELVDGRAKTCPMIETAQAMTRIDDILEIDGVDELFIGLNDLHISMGLTFMFEILSGGLIDFMAEKIKAKGIPFGFGGMGKIGEGDLPAEQILYEHYRVGSDAVILSRTFRNEVGSNRAPVNLSLEVQKIRNEESKAALMTANELLDNHISVRGRVSKIVNDITSVKK